MLCTAWTFLDVSCFFVLFCFLLLLPWLWRFSFSLVCAVFLGVKTERAVSTSCLGIRSACDLRSDLHSEHLIQAEANRFEVLPPSWAHSRTCVPLFTQCSWRWYWLLPELISLLKGFFLFQSPFLLQIGVSSLPFWAGYSLHSVQQELQLQVLFQAVSCPCLVLICHYEW